jgi:hypothetical protein
MGYSPVLEVSMRKVPPILSAAALLLASTFAVPAQSNTDVVAAPPFDRVVLKCTEVSQNPDIADPRFGICVSETRDYIRSLAGLPPELIQSTLVDLVVALGELSRLGNEFRCTVFDDEIAQAILLVSNASTNPEQRESIIAIADTIIETCDDPAFATASIGSVD